MSEPTQRVISGLNKIPKDEPSTKGDVRADTEGMMQEQPRIDDQPFLPPESDDLPLPDKDLPEPDEELDEFGRSWWWNLK